MGTFLADPTDVPPEVAEYVAAQLGIPDPACLKLYGQREPTHREHAGEIQRFYGYRDFSEASAGLRDFLAARAWTSNDGPRALFDRATAWLVEHKVLLPGATTLARLVAAVRTDASERLWDQIASGIDDDLRSRLNALLEVEEGSRFSVLERLRTSPAKLTGSELERALKRVAEVRRLGAAAADLSALPGNRLWPSLGTALARRHRHCANWQNRGGRRPWWPRSGIQKSIDDALDLLEVWRP